METNFVLENTTFRKISPNAAPARKSDAPTSPSAAPGTKSDTQTSPSAAPATRSHTTSCDTQMCDVSDVNDVVRCDGDVVRCDVSDV